MATERSNGMNNPCPLCGIPMEQISDEHYHCSCGVCLLHGKRLQWHVNVEKTYCPESWVKDEYVKTGNLA